MWRTTMKAVNFYEVMDRKGDIAWGGASASEAVKWFRKGFDNAIFVSVWNEEDIEEPVLVTDKIEVTGLLLATFYVLHTSMNERDQA
jgi:hypothetical protein